MAHVLVVDDDDALRRAWSLQVSALGHEVYACGTLGEALAAAARGGFDLVVLDVVLPDGNGIAALGDFLAVENHPEVLVVTGMGDSSQVRTALEGGAWDYLRKPVSFDDLALHVSRALQYREERGRHTTRLLKQEGIVGESAALRRCLAQVAQAASSEASVLLTGETGTGKELFSRAIHDNSPRSGRSFVVVDCATLPRHLVESTLFGHHRGAFTGADREQTGLVKLADGGTLFLDEVGELPLAMQRAFLRVLQERRFRPVGGEQELQSDFRLVAATNRDLDAMAARGDFREDLLFRLRTMHIHLPPLRERREDIAFLLAYQLDRLARRHEVEMPGVSPDFPEALRAYHWPGNVRELLGVVESALVQAGESRTLFAAHLPLEIRAARKGHKPGSASNAPRTALPNTKPPDQDLETFGEFRRQAVAAAERQYLELLLAASPQDMAAACRTAGLSRSRLYELLQKHGLSR